MNLFTSSSIAVYHFRFCYLQHAAGKGLMPTKPTRICTNWRTRRFYTLLGRPLTSAVLLKRDPTQLGLGEVFFFLFAYRGN